MAWAIEGSDCASKRGVDISQGRGHVTNCGRRAVQLVLGVKNEQGFERTYDDFALPMLRLRSEGHAKEVRNIAEIRIGLNDVFAHENTKAGCSDGRGLTDDAVNMQVALCLILVGRLTSMVRWVRLRVARRQARNEHLQSAHRMCIFKLLLLESLNDSS